MSSFITLEELLSDETPELRARMQARGREAVRAEALRQLRALAKKKQAMMRPLTLAPLANGGMAPSCRPNSS